MCRNTDIRDLCARSDADEKYTWNLSDLYGSDDEWEADKECALAMVADFKKKYLGAITTAADVNAALAEYREIAEKLVIIQHYTSLAFAANMLDDHLAAMEMKCVNAINHINTELSFFESALVALDESILKEAAKIEDDRNFLNKLLEEKPHMLTPETEAALSRLGISHGAFYRIYDAAKMQDMVFPSYIAGGAEHPLSYNIFEGMLENSNNTEMRRKGFEAFSSKLAEYRNVTAAAYLAHCQTEKAYADLRGYDSVIDYLLFEQRVSRDMYDRQIDIIMKELAPHMRKYAGLIKRSNKLDKITFADLKIDIDPEFDKVITPGDAAALVKDGLAVLGEDYQGMLAQAFDERWIDFVNTEGKATGAFCASPYGNHSYILISWTGKLTEAIVLAHELGHAGHFYNCNRAQNILDAEPSMYYVEAPSTANELIVANHLLNKAESPRERRYILSQIIARTYFHNFVTHLHEAAYQRKVYEIIDAGGSFSADDLSEIYKGVLREFWSEDVELTDGCELTWMRQPHYYMGLYSFTYSAGLTIGTRVAQMIGAEGNAAVDRWLAALSGGDRLKPLEFAKTAGVDISSEKPLRETIAYIGSIIDEIERLTDEIEREK